MQKGLIGGEGTCIGGAGGEASGGLGGGASGDADKKKKKTWLLGEFEGRRSTHHQVGEWGTDARDGARTGVSERLPSAHPEATSTRCVWTQVHAGVVAICSD
jgi:hypothetical protein